MSKNNDNAIEIEIDSELISYLEDLSCLSFTQSEKERLADDLKVILSHMARLSQLDTDGVNECSHPFDIVNAFREDELQASFDRILILKNAPEKDDEMLIVPKTV